MQAIPAGLRTHSQKVCSFYKRALRNLQSWHTEYPHYRYVARSANVNISVCKCRSLRTRMKHDSFRFEALKLRKQLDENKDIKDLRVAKDLLQKGEHDLFEMLHCQPLKFPTSPGGCAFDRHVTPPDWVLDLWEPMEKAMYPKYFALREKRKKEYVEWYNKQYPDAQKDFSSHH